jgi:hypothetical protein
MKTCGDYREVLIDAAAGGAEPSRELRSHLDACGSCRAAFTEEVQLFAAIDAGVRVSANAEVPASLLPRVRVQLPEQVVPRHSWVPVGAALAAAVVLVTVIVFARGFGSGPHGADREVNSAASDVPRPLIQAAPPGIVLVERATRTARHEPSRPTRKAVIARAEELTVLIPIGQKRAIDALLLGVQHGKVDGGVLLAEKPEKTLEELQVVPLDVSPIEVKPLADVSAEPASQNEKTER